MAKQGRSRAHAPRAMARFACRGRARVCKNASARRASKQASKLAQSPGVAAHLAHGLCGRKDLAWSDAPATLPRNGIFSVAWARTKTDVWALGQTGIVDTGTGRRG